MYLRAYTYFINALVKLAKKRFSFKLKKIVVDKRKTRTFGHAYVDEGLIEIFIRNRTGRYRTLECIRCTLAHELAHLIVKEKAEHGKLWRKMYPKVNSYLRKRSL